MKLARLAIHQPIFVSMVLVALTLLGALAYSNMGVNLYPDMTNPVVFVSVSFPGASPEDVERLVTKPVEDAVSTVSGVSTISSSSREGFSNVTVSFVLGHPLQQGVDEVRDRVNSIRRRLPVDAEEPTLRRFDPNSSPIMTVALRIEDSLTPEEIRRFVEEIITPRLERQSGVAAISVSGLRSQEVGVDLNARQMKALGVSPQQVLQALQRENVIQPSGRLTGAGEDVPLRTSAEIRSLDELRRIVVARRATSVTTLQDVATAQVRLIERHDVVRLDGRDTLMISVQKQSGSNIVETAHLVRNEIESLHRDFPKLDFSIIRDDSTFIEESDRDVTITLLIGAILAAAIVFIFFRNTRNTLITVAGLPIVVIGTFAVISLLGFTRNIITLMALSLSIGLLIDDAIVVRENIFRYMEAGASPREAAEKATGEIAFAVLAMTLTLVAVFIPVTFTTGQVGMLLKEFGITVAVAVLISLFEAFTFAPLLTAYVGKPLDPRNGEKLSHSKYNPAARWDRAWPAIAKGYGRLLGWSLRHRWLIAGTSTAAFVLCLVAMRFMPTGFFPVTDPGMVTVGINLPPGTPSDTTDRLALEVEKVVMAQPEVKQVYTRVGSSNSGSLSLYLKDGARSDALVTRLRQMFPQAPRGTLTFSVPRQFMGVGGGMGGGSVRSRPVQIAVRGPVELDSLEAAADKIIERLRTVPGIRDAEKSLPPREPEMQILVDRQRAAQAGVSPTVVGQTIRYLVSGFTATTVDWSDRRLNVNVRLRPEDRADTSAILDLPVAGTGGQMFTMRSVATADRGTGPTVLDRQDRLRQISVGANLENRTAGAVVPDINAALEGIELPAGVTWKFAGEQAQTDTAFSSLIFALMLGLVFIYMVLASQFGSLIHPLTVMVALPLSIIGAVLAMLAARLELTVVAMIGIILLMGLVTKNSILLVDFIIRYRREGRSRHEAVITAGPVRLRPILMTTLAVLLGMIPTALGLGVAGAFRAPMAIAVLGGVISSTALSLLVVPVVYTLMDDGMLAVSRRLGLNGLMTSTSVTTGETGARNDGADTAGQGGKPRRDWRKPGTWFRSY